jgi:hypothetical protein
MNLAIGLSHETAAALPACQVLICDRLSPFFPPFFKLFYLCFQVVVPTMPEWPNGFLRASMMAARALTSESIRPSTNLRYQQAYARFEKFCASAEVPALPAAPEHLAACLALVASETQSVSAVEAVYAAVSHRNQQEGMASPTSNPAVRLLMRAVRRKFGCARRQVKALDENLLRRMVDYLKEAERSTTGG